jgi:hypothetical protein
MIREEPGNSTVGAVDPVELIDSVFSCCHAKLGRNWMYSIRRFLLSDRIRFV